MSLLGLVNSTAEQQSKKKKSKKQPFTIHFDSEVDFASSFSKGKVMKFNIASALVCSLGVYQLSINLLVSI